MTVGFVIKNECNLVFNANYKYWLVFWGIDVEVWTEPLIKIKTNFSYSCGDGFSEKQIVEFVEFMEGDARWRYFKSINCVLEDCMSKYTCSSGLSNVLGQLDTDSHPHSSHHKYTFWLLTV